MASLYATMTLSVSLPCGLLCQNAAFLLSLPQYPAYVRGGSATSLLLYCTAETIFDALPRVRKACYIEEEAMMTIEGAEDKGNAQSSLLRIYVLGTLDIQWPNINIPFPKERMLGRGAAPALGLLKAHITQPDRFALRDWLMEQFWPESAQSRADERLDDVASGLRGLLRPPGCTAKILHFVYGKDGKGNGYRLEGYPQIWVDADAFEWYVSQAARLDRFERDSLSLWEQAYQLGSRGEFLPDERYSDWVQPRRERIAGQYRQCVHRVVQLLRQIGAYEQALLRLRSYWQEHKTDEDALRSLLEMLGERERYQEAEEYYEQARGVIQLEHGDLDERTKDVMECLRAQPIQRERAIEQALSTAKQISPLGLTQEYPFHERSPQLGEQHLFASSMDGDVLLYLDEWIQDWKVWFVPGTLLLDDTMFNTSSSRNGTDSGRSLMQTRRRMLNDLLMVGSTALVLSHHMVFFPDGSEYDHPIVLEELERITTSYWRLRANTSLDVLDNIVGHFRTVINLLQQSFPCSATQRLYSLLSETAQLLGQTLFDLHEHALAWSYYMFSLKAAQTASNHDLWAVGSGRMVLLLIYWKMPKIAPSLLQEVRQLTIESTRIACWLFAVEAEVCAHLDDADGCDSALEAAQKLLEGGPLDEDRYATGFNPSRLAGYEGACFVRLRQPERALPALKHALALLDPQAIRRQSTLFTDLGIAHAQQGNIKEACAFANQALALTTRTKSRAVLERVRTLCSELEPWKETETVKDLVKQLDKTVALITA
jgi:DNA-binding SARP family transcriptional activator